MNTIFQPAFLWTFFGFSILGVSSGCEREGAVSASLTQARALMASSQPEAAIPVLRRLLDEENDAEMEYLLASALLDTGAVDEAWERFRRLLDRGSSFDALPVRAARALNRLERFRESRELLLDHVTQNPGDRAALHVLSVALRRLGNSEAALALTQRRRELELAQWEENRSQASGNAAWKTLERARSLVRRSRLADALEAIDEGLQDKTGQLDRRTFRLLALLKAEVFMKIVGVRDDSEALWKIVKQSRMPEVDLARARLLLRLGAMDTTLDILSETEEVQQVAGLGKDLLRAHRARLLVELGKLQGELTAFVEKPFANTPLGSRDPEIAELANFCRAELLMANGRPDSARRVVGQSSFTLAGGTDWASAIRIVVDRDPHADVSALVDYPHVLQRGLRVAELKNDKNFQAIATRVEKLFAARRVVFSGEDSEEAWSRLLKIYTDAGALRKAREIAWFRWSARPEDVSSTLVLAKTLSRPEEVCERLSVVQAALKRHPGDESLVRLRARDLKFLGVEP